MSHMSQLLYMSDICYTVMYCIKTPTKDTQRNLGNLIIYKDTQRYPEKPGEVKDALRRLNLPRDA